MYRNIHIYLHNKIKILNLRFGNTITIYNLLKDQFFFIELFTAPILFFNAQKNNI